MFGEKTTDGDAVSLPSTHKLRDSHLGHGRCISIHPTPQERALNSRNRVLKKQHSEMEDRMSKMEAMLKALTGGNI